MVESNSTGAPPGQDHNPYAQQQPQQPPPVQPRAAVPPGTRGPSGYVSCPRCGDVNVQKVGFTWWGGLLGPSLFCHCKCQRCGLTFNGKTGKSNNTAIAIYMIAGIAIAIVLIAMIALAGG